MQVLVDSFHIHSDLRQGDALSPLTLSFALECVIRKVPENLGDLV
jgi:hypothetical protein